MPRFLLTILTIKGIPQSFFTNWGKEKKITCTNLESLVLRQTYSRRKVEWSLAPEELRASVFVKDVWFMLEAEGCPRSLTQIAR
jgi:hypothetical protein